MLSLIDIDVHFQNLNCFHFLDGWDKICAEMYSSCSGNDPLYCFICKEMQSLGQKTQNDKKNLSVQNFNK